MRFSFRAVTTKSIYAAMLVAISIWSAGQAQAGVFTFSFTVDGVDAPGNSAPLGTTVTGEIFGLSDNGLGQAASDIVITSYSTPINPFPDAQGPGAPFDGFSYYGATPEFNSFDVVDGVITNVNFGDSGSAGSLILDLGGDYNILSFYSPSNYSAYGAENGEGLPGLNFSEEAPEPASLALMGAGLAGVGLMRRRKRA